MSLDRAFEEDAASLARWWLDTPHGDTTAARSIELLVTAALQRGDGRLAAMSAGFEAIAMAMGLDATLPRPAGRRMDTLVALVRASGVARAEWLLEVSLAHGDRHHPARAAQALQRLGRLLSPEAGERPAFEAVWGRLSACQLACVVGDFDSALRHGLQARALARDSGSRACTIRAAHMLAYTFLSVGDVEATITVLSGAPDADGSAAVRSASLDYNHLLALTLAGRIQAAWQHLQRKPGLLSSTALGGQPALRVLGAHLQARLGQVDAAWENLLANEQAPAHAVPLPPSVAANGAWLGAEVCLLAGRPAEALHRIDTLLRHAEAEGWVLSPMNRTQLYRVRALAAEAQGNLREAVDALRRSQDACFHWVADSVRIRLQAMHLEDSGADDERLQRRLHAVSQASQQAARGDATRWLAQVSHEMRHPLQGMLSMTSLLALSDLDRHQRQYLEMARSSAQLLLSLCNDVLDLAHLDTGHFRLQPVPTELRPLVGELVRLYRAQIDARTLRLDGCVDDALPERVMVDPLRLKQVLMNLLGNAVRHTAQGRIEVRAQWTPPGADGGRGQLRMEVCDSGTGLSPERLADPFQESAPAAGGAGLGLALCRRLVERMGGRIGVSVPSGSGSCFWFELPAAAA